ncbi:endonuclease V [Lewinella lacunae]|uniref:Endonuclease V n=2 Tax=Neolewinella lacunae TaxID=1517758 RepID=A0A923T8W8_9BACT|nr:endonuclease V [Neolewinella lacunae]
MIYAFDLYYREEETVTACVGFENWSSTAPALQLTEKSKVESDYISGQFYKRELPGILQLLQKIDLQPGDLIIVDGYVYLDDEKSNGLGGHLYEALDKQFPIIGVAKKKYHSLEKEYREVYRGQSQKPLFITAAGFDLEEAQCCVEGMAGTYRIPDLLKIVDQLSKGMISPEG